MFTVTFHTHHDLRMDVASHHRVDSVRIELDQASEHMVLWLTVEQAAELARQVGQVLIPFEGGTHPADGC